MMEFQIMDNQTLRDGLTGKVGKHHFHCHTVSLGSYTLSSEQLLVGSYQSYVAGLPLYRGETPASRSIPILRSWFASIQRGNAWVPYSGSPMDADCSSTLHYESVWSKVWSNLPALSYKQVLGVGTAQGWFELSSLNFSGAVLNPATGTTGRIQQFQSRSTSR